MGGVDINKALRIYFGSDSRGGVVPYGGDGRVESKYGPRTPAVLEAINKVLHALVVPNDVTQQASLQEIGAFAEQLARSRFPELEDDVCRAIGNYVSYSWR